MLWNVIQQCNVLATICCHAKTIARIRSINKLLFPSMDLKLYNICDCQQVNTAYSLEWSPNIVQNAVNPYLWIGRAKNYN